MLDIELIPDPTEGGYTARVPDIPAYREGESPEEAIADLREALRGYIEAFGLEDAMERVNSLTVQTVDWNLTELAHGQAAAC